MSRQNPTPAIASAVEYVLQNLENGVWKKGDRLPPIRKLATLAGVSKVTMAKALIELKQKGHIHSHKRSRSWIGPVPSTTEKTEVHGTSTLVWHRQRDLLEKEIVTGTFGSAGRLPSAKELGARYGASFRTIRKVLDALEKGGVIRTNGNGYSIAGLRNRSFRRKIVFITSTGYFSQTSALNHEHNRIVNLFENECLRLGLQLDVVEIDFFDPSSARSAGTRLDLGSTVAGYIVDVWWSDSKGFGQSYLELLARLGASKKPVALLDEFGVFALPVQFSLNPLFQVFSIEGIRAGERMARFLIGLGHRSVAYISLFRDSIWSSKRCQGIVSQFERSGFHNGVSVVDAQFEMPLEMVLAKSGLTDEEVMRIIGSGRTRSQALDLEGLWRRAKIVAPQIDADSLVVDAELKANLAGIVSLAPKGVSADFFDAMCSSALSASAARLFANFNRPLYQEALDNTNATAWICASDGMAVGALAFLAEKGIAVPDAISVVGFDNVPGSALENRLTTFDFNAMSFIHQMLNFIIRPPRPRGRYRHETVEVEGMIIERATSGKPNAAAAIPLHG